MNKINFLKRLTYQPRIRNLISALGLSGIARKLYWIWTKPKNDILTFEVRGIIGQFHIHTPGELRLQEGLIFREKHTLELLISFLHPEDIVYDIGAQVGLYTVLLAKAVGEKGRVIAFEPESQSFQCLQENIKLNKLNNVRFFQKALGEHSQKLELYAGKNGKWCSLMKPPVDREDISPQIVQVLRGDDLRKDEDLPIPQLIKIDVEGWEYSVLKGLSKTISYPECKLILVEVHPTMLPAGIRIDSVKELLKEADFISFEIFVRGSEYHLFASRSKINS